MLFTSFQFLIFFTILFVIFFVVRKHNYQIYTLLIASYIFYGAWNPYYVLLIMLVSFIGWGCGYLIAGSDHAGRRKTYLWASIIGSLGILAYFKYANFFIDNISGLVGRQISYLDIILPVGISFFTFQSLSYTIDLYRRNIPPCYSLPKFFLFVSFFPQLVAGPIVRASEFLPQLDRKIIIEWKNVTSGAQIFLIGAVQKAFIANNLSPFVDRVFEQPELYSGSTVWLAAISYTIQIFCDFSGYSLMAIGVAKVFGFHLPENFRMPYLATSITDFWRRWHITLSTWLRDYLYISLGGNRLGENRTQINLLVTMLLGGLWHGASWNFVLWGFMHGFGLIVHKLWCKYSQSFLSDHAKALLAYKMLAWLVTFLFVVLLWVPFRSTDFGNTLVIYAKLFSLEQGVEWHYTHSLILIMIAVSWHLFYASKFRMIFSFPYQDFGYKNLFVVGALLMAIILFAPLDSSPFIYFQF